MYTFELDQMPQGERIQRMVPKQGRLEKSWVELGDGKVEAGK